MSDSRFLLYVTAFAIIAVGFFVVFGNRFASETTLVGEALADEGQEHIQQGEAHDAYQTSPPASGPHYTEPADWGYYDQELADEQLVHNLEHGGIWVSYKPGSLSNDELGQLKELSTKYSQRLIVTPRALNDSKMAVSSWRRQEKRQSFDKEIIEQFLKTNVNQSPEKVAR